MLGTFDPICITEVLFGRLFCGVVSLLPGLDPLELALCNFLRDFPLLAPENIRRLFWIPSILWNSTSLVTTFSYSGLIFQKLPLPGSPSLLGIFMKKSLRERLCLTEF